MGLASYAILEKGTSWTILHDGEAPNEYASKEAAFEAAVAAASLAIRQGHEGQACWPGREAGYKTALGVPDSHS